MNRKNAVNLVGILAILLIVMLPMASAQIEIEPENDKITSEIVKLDDRALNFVTEVSSDIIAERLSFTEQGKAVNLDFEGYDEFDKKIDIGSISNFQIIIDSSNPTEYKWSYEFRLPDIEFVPRIRVQTDEDMRVVDGKYIIVGEKNLISFEDVLSFGFGYSVSPVNNREAVVTLTKDWAKFGINVNDLILIDPSMTAYPTIDGYLDRDEFGVFGVYTASNPNKAGNDVGATDRIYRTYYKFNTSQIDAWDDIINATFNARISVETCGAGESAFWLQNISNFGDLGESDWSISHQNITLWYNTTTNGSGWYDVNVTDWISKGDFTYYRVQGTYEQYAGVDCFININSNESAFEPYLEIYWNDTLPTAPSIKIHSPLNQTYYANDVPLDVSSYGGVGAVDTWWYSTDGGSTNITFTPNTTLTLASGSHCVDVWLNNTYGAESHNQSCFTVTVFNIIYPLGHSIDEFTCVPLIIDTDACIPLDEVSANITYPNGSSTMRYNFSKGLDSDNFDTDTEGINWVKNNITEAGQTCFADIDGTASGKVFIEVDGGNGTQTMHCGFNSIKRLNGDFDFNISFDTTALFETDAFFTLRSNSIDSFYAMGVRVFIVVIKQNGNIFYRFGYNNGEDTTSYSFPTTDITGKLRIRRFNTSGTPIFNLYYWNNTASQWINPLGNINMSNSNMCQIIQLKAGSEGDGWGRLNITLDDFSVTADNYTLTMFSDTATHGIYNFTITVNNTCIDANTSSYFNIYDQNDAPSRPFFTEPDAGDTVSDMVNIIWSQVIDEEGDSLQFNLTLLNPNGTFHSVIVSDYGDANSTSYSWNSSAITYGWYGLKITVFENATAEQLTVSETLDGNFLITNLGNATIGLHLYYEPYVTTNTQTTIYAVVKDLLGNVFDTAYVNITIDGSTADMTWDDVTSSYIVYWIPSADGIYNFTVRALTNQSTLIENGSIFVGIPFNVTIRLWNNINMTYDSRYINEFAWIYAQRNIDYPSLSELFTAETKYPCPPQSPTECHWHGQYINGTAEIELYEAGNYSFYLIGNRIQWIQNMDSGYWIECDFCQPHAVQQRLLLNLGEYHLNGASEDFDMFYSEYELYYVGAFFGGMTSWLWAGLMVLIGIIFFFIILFATHSLKSAMAGLVLVPVIIQLILMFGI